MFKKKEIDLIYRIICLFVFIIVVTYVRSIITLSILALFFVFLTRDDVRILAIILYFVTAISFMACFNSVDYTLFRIALIMDTAYYFLIIPTLDDVVKMVLGLKDEPNEEKIEDKVEKVQNKLNTDSYYIRFSNDKKIEKINKKKKSEAISAIYVTAHLLLLFIAIVVG